MGVGRTTLGLVKHFAGLVKDTHPGRKRTAAQMLEWHPSIRRSSFRARRSYISTLRARVSSVGFRICDPALKTADSALRTADNLGPLILHSVMGVQVSGFVSRDSGSGIRALGFGIRVPGLDFGSAGDSVRVQSVPPALCVLLGGVRPFHQKSTCLTQSTSESYVVQIWSRNTPRPGPTETCVAHRVETPLAFR
jgi:hypothetical protein